MSVSRSSTVLGWGVDTTGSFNGCGIVRRSPRSWQPHSICCFVAGCASLLLCVTLRQARPTAGSLVETMGLRSGPPAACPPKQPASTGRPLGSGEQTNDPTTDVSTSQPTKRPTNQPANWRSERRPSPTQHTPVYTPTCGVAVLLWPVVVVVVVVVGHCSVAVCSRNPIQICDDED